MPKIGRSRCKYTHFALIVFASVFSTFESQVLPGTAMRKWLRLLLRGGNAGITSQWRERIVSVCGNKFLQFLLPMSCHIFLISFCVLFVFPHNINLVTASLPYCVSLGNGDIYLL